MIVYKLSFVVVFLNDFFSLNDGCEIVDIRHIGIVLEYLSGEVTVKALCFKYLHRALEVDGSLKELNELSTAVYAALALVVLDVDFKGLFGNKFYGSAIHIGDKKATSHIKNSTVEIKGDYPAKLVDHWGREIPCADDKAGIFDAMITIKVENCRFINIKRQLFVPCFDTRKFSLKDCQFINCEKDIIKGAKKENCIFE